jgi:hypothetical protein
MAHEDELLQDLEAIRHDHDEVFKVRSIKIQMYIFQYDFKWNEFH